MNVFYRVFRHIILLDLSYYGVSIKKSLFLRFKLLKLKHALLSVNKTKLKHVIKEKRLKIILYICAINN